MHSLWYKERGKYTKSSLINDFGIHGNKIVSRLLSANILRPIKDNSDEDIIDDMIEVSDSDFQLFTLNFCGTILLDDYLIHCYPKYINKQDYKASFPLVLKAIQKYQKKNIQRIYMGQSGHEKYGLIPLILSIVKDYRKNGLYHCVKKRYVLNGPGETDWQTTIEKYEPFFINKRPFYFDRDTFLTRNDEENLFRLIHMAIIEECYTT